MNQKVEKIIKLHELKDELKKKNKFLDYNPITDTIIIEGRISIKCDEIFKEKFYGETIKEISHKLNKKVSATLYGFEKIKNGEVPKECEIEKLCPLFHSYETIEKMNLIFNTEMHNQFKENSIDKEIIERYSLNIFLNPFHQKIGLLFSYDIDGIIFPLTLAQFKKMKINETDFIQETLKNSQEKMEEEIKNFSKENGFLNEYKDVYMFNQTKFNVNSTIPGIEKHFHSLNEILGYYVDKIFLYPINEEKFALIDGLISGEDLIERINYLNNLKERNINLGLFQITSDTSSSIMLREE